MSRRDITIVVRRDITVSVLVVRSVRNGKPIVTAV
jgi:hypothetical protein